jgi:hypothetical protein
VALTHKKINSKKATLTKNHIKPGTIFKRSFWTGGNHPPRNKIVDIELIKIILPYSPRKNKPNDIDEYSTLYPATSSDSASGRSKGALFVSANVEIKKITNIGKCGIMYQTFS